jgi:hypothetical protein
LAEEILNGARIVLNKTGGIMSKKTLGIVLMIAGVVVIIVSFAANAIRLGTAPGLGLMQALGAVAGVIILVIGAGFWPGFPPSRTLANNPGSQNAVAAKKQRGSALSKKAQVSKSSRGSGRARKSAKRRK